MRTIGASSRTCAHSPPQRGHSLLELAMSWLGSRPFISSIIAGATKPEQVEQNVAAVGWALSRPELAEIDRMTAVDVGSAKFEMSDLRGRNLSRLA